MLQEISRRQQVAIEAIQKAGKVLLQGIDGNMRIEEKPDGTLVTDVDLKAERVILEHIRDKFPDDGFFSEERGLKDSKSSYRWIIDPLDGTHNFIRGIRVIGSSIALQFKDAVVLGVIYIPFTKELYVARKGEGSYRNGQRIRVSKQSLAEATMSFDSNIINDTEGVMIEHLRKVIGKVFNLRMFGSTARSLSYLAEGRIDVAIEYTDNIYDFAAGAFLIEEAGGKVTDFEGKRWGIHTKGYVASNGLIHREILRIINK